VTAWRGCKFGPESSGEKALLGLTYLPAVTFMAEASARVSERVSTFQTTQQIQNNIHIQEDCHSEDFQIPPKFSCQDPSWALPLWSSNTWSQKRSYSLPYLLLPPPLSLSTRPTCTAESKAPKLRSPFDGDMFLIINKTLHSTPLHFTRLLRQAPASAFLLDRNTQPLPENDSTIYTRS